MPKDKWFYKKSQKFTLSSKLLALCFMLCGGILFCWLLYPNIAISGPYLDSAHGNTSYGVDRTGLASFGYSKGNCAHCHEQHAMIGGSEPNPTGGPDKYELFRSLFVDQSSMFCYGCHSAAVESLQSPTFNNFSYSYTRGGNTALTCPGDIKTAFQYEDTSGNSNAINPCPSIPTFGSSAHTLSTIQSFLVSKTGYGFPTQANNNPCSGCHDPHRAQRNYPVSQPSTHDPLISWELWGDDDNTTERLPVAVKVPPGTNGYMSPYKVGSGYEEDTFPAGTAGRQTRFKTVCRDCHDNAPVPSGLVDVSWNNAKHGGTNAGSNPQYGGLKAPYSTATPTQYNMDCTDCHEPHGSRNEYLLRSTVNGVTNIRIANSSGNYQTGRWYNFCIACHTYLSTQGPHNPVSQGVPNVQDMNCTFGSCHGHGNLHF